MTAHCKTSQLRQKNRKQKTFLYLVLINSSVTNSTHAKTVLSIHLNMQLSFLMNPFKTAKERYQSAWFVEVPMKFVHLYKRRYKLQIQLFMLSSYNFIQLFRHIFLWPVQELVTCQRGREVLLPGWT